MEYESLDQVRQEWLSGQFKYPEEMMVAGIPYHFRSSSARPFHETVLNDRKIYLIYATPKKYKEDAENANMHQWLVFMWGMGERSHVLPYDLRTTTPARGSAVGMTESQERIGDVVILKINMPSGTMAVKGKVDTGAEISSLHADQIKIVGDTVKFTSSEMSQNVITMPLVDKQAVSSADGGVEYRPVIELDIEINGKPVRKAIFNLNDRSKMEYPCLIGQNVLEKTNFLVDPRQDDPDKEQEPIREWVEELEVTSELLETFDEEFKDIEPAILLDGDKQEQLEKLYRLMDESDLSFNDVVKHIRTDARQVFDNIEY